MSSGAPPRLGAATRTLESVEVERLQVASSAEQEKLFEV